MHYSCIKKGILYIYVYKKKVPFLYIYIMFDMGILYPIKLLEYQIFSNKKMDKKYV